MFINKDESIHICDFKNHRIYVFDRHGTFGRALGALAKPPVNCKIRAGSGEINSAIYHLYVPDYNNHRVQIVHGKGDCIGAYGS